MQNRHYIAYKVDGYNVILLGQVSRPTLKSDAENAVKHIEGVEKIDNQIEVRAATEACKRANATVNPFEVRTTPGI